MKALFRITPFIQQMSSLKKVIYLNCSEEKNLELDHDTDSIMVDSTETDDYYLDCSNNIYSNSYLKDFMFNTSINIAINNNGNDIHAIHAKPEMEKIYGSYLYC